MDKFDLWRHNWHDYLLGREWSPDTIYGEQVITSIERMADTPFDYQNDYSNFSLPDYSFALHAKVIAYFTKGTKHFANKEIKTEILEELNRIYADEYNLSTSPENWWFVQIGNPLRILDILILLYDEIENINLEIEKWTEVILHFQNAYSLTSRGQLETGANLMWKCQVYYLTGILRKEQALIDMANEWLPSIICYAGSKNIPNFGKNYDDGFFEDGSFVQHYMFAYTGGYGKHLLNVLCGLLYAFDNTGLITLSDEKKSLFYKFVHESFEPLIYNGKFMDFARGREITRYFGQDEMIGRFVIRSLCYLVQTMPPEEKQCMIAMLKEWLTNKDVTDNLLKDEYVRAEYYILPSFAEVYEKVIQSDVIPRGELIGHYNFGVVSKVVHLAKNFGFAISMYSKFIACYERLGFESEKMWHISDGMTYLYTLADSNQYNHDYYATVDTQRLAGTTVDRSPNRITDPYYDWYTPEARNVYAFAGGATLGNFGSAGLQYCGQGEGKERSLEVKKSWFMFDDKVVCIGSGITSPTGNPIETTIDNIRLTDTYKVKITGNSQELKQNQQKIKAATLHFAEVLDTISEIGYYFPKETSVTVLREHRVGTWCTSTVNPDNKKENDFATFYIEHGTCPTNADYAYIVLPNFSLTNLEAYATNPDIEIIENSINAHVVRETTNHIIAANFWNNETYTTTGITSSSQCCLIMQDTDHYTEIAISDPTKMDSIIELSFDFNATNIVTADQGIEVVNSSPLSVKVNTKDSDGKSIKLKIIK